MLYDAECIHICARIISIRNRMQDIDIYIYNLYIFIPQYTSAYSCFMPSMPPPTHNSSCPRIQGAHGLITAWRPTSSAPTWMEVRVSGPVASQGSMSLKGGPQVVAFSLLKLETATCLCGPILLKKLLQGHGTHKNQEPSYAAQEDLEVDQQTPAY